MRLWHKYLIGVLPRKQLVSQWRECCCIASNIKNKGTPGSLLVNKILDYPDIHFDYYTLMVCQEMIKRGYKCDWTKYSRHRNNIGTYELKYNGCIVSPAKVFHQWHNDGYLRQCYYNLQEKHDCGGISEDEWKRFEFYALDLIS